MIRSIVLLYNEKRTEAIARKRKKKALTNKFNETHKPLMKGVKFDERENVEIMCRTERDKNENKLIATVL